MLVPPSLPAALQVKWEVAKSPDKPQTACFFQVLKRIYSLLRNKGKTTPLLSCTVQKTGRKAEHGHTKHVWKKGFARHCSLKENVHPERDYLLSLRSNGAYERRLSSIKAFCIFTFCLELLFSTPSPSCFFLSFPSWESLIIKKEA